MRSRTVNAGLDAVFEGKATAALIAKEIQRAVAEKTIEAVLFYTLMTGEVFTFLITIKS